MVPRICDLPPHTVRYGGGYLALWEREHLGSREEMKKSEREASRLLLGPWLLLRPRR